MLRTIAAAGLGFSAAVSLLAAPAAASSQTRACAAKAAQQGLSGTRRSAFLTTCRKGALAPRTPTAPTHSESATAVVAPSGADRTDRSSQCNAEGARRGLHDAALQSFRKGCLASAAPVGAIETGRTPTVPTKAIPKIDKLTNKPPQ